MNMAVNNWHVASKVRRMGFWTDIPLIGTFFGAHLSTDQVKVGFGGVVVILAVLSQYPSSDWIGKIITGILLSILTIISALKSRKIMAQRKLSFKHFSISSSRCLKQNTIGHYQLKTLRDIGR